MIRTRDVAQGVSRAAMRAAMGAAMRAALLLLASEALAAQAPRDTTPPRVPFAFGDFTWLNGNSRQSTSVLDSKYITGELRVDANYVFSFNHPSDHTLVGSAETGRTNEMQLQQLGIGGDFHTEHARARLMTQFGMYSVMTPRNDASPPRGQPDLSAAYRYLSEADSAKVRNGLPPVHLEPEDTVDNGASIGAVNIVSSATMRAVGQWDETFEGSWYDDTAMHRAFQVAAGEPRWVEGPGWHLYHLPGWTGEHLTDEDKAATARNSARWNLYSEAATPEQIRELTMGVR